MADTNYTNQDNFEETGGCKRPFNPLDPAVYFDPNFDQVIIADITPNMRDNTNEIHNMNVGSDVDPLLVEGVKVPKVQVGGKVLLNEMIMKFVLDYQYVMPTLYLEVLVNAGDMQSETYLSLNNVVRIAFRPSTDGKYKKIAWNFHIIKSEKSNNIMKIWCVLKFEPLLSLPKISGPLKLSEFTKMQLSDIPMGKYFGLSNTDGEVMENEEESNESNPTDEEQNQEDNRQYNCCQILAEIANQTGLGFAATDHCIDDKSKMVVQMSGKPCWKFIQDTVRKLGSTQYVYDAWVDPYGYLVLVNMAYLFKTDVEPDHLVVMGLTGLYNESSWGPKPKFVPVRRSITNFNQTHSPSNLQFGEYNMLLNFGNIYKNGTDKEFVIITPEDGSLVPDADPNDEQPTEENKAVESTNVEATTPDVSSTPKQNTVSKIKKFDMRDFEQIILNIASPGNQTQRTKHNAIEKRFEQYRSELYKNYQYLSDFLSVITNGLGILWDTKTTDLYEGLMLPWKDVHIMLDLENEIQEETDEFEACIDLFIRKLFYTPSITVTNWNFLRSNEFLYEVGIQINITVPEKEVSSEQINNNNNSSDKSDIDIQDEQDEAKSNSGKIETLDGTGEETDSEVLEFSPNNSASSVDIMTNPIGETPGMASNEFRSASSKEQVVNINNSANYAIQREVSKNYIQNKRSSKLKVVMNEINMGLERGTWIQVAVFAHGIGQKAKIMHEELMLPMKGEDKVFFGTKDVDTGGIKKEAIMTDDEVVLPNDKLSDLYYIDGMTFEYTPQIGKIRQILYLIKRSPLPISQ